MTSTLTKLGGVVAAGTLVLLSSPAPLALALAPPVADLAALPPDGPPGPSQPMRQNSNGACSFNGAMEGFDPAAIPPSQAMLNLPEAWKFSRGAGVTVAVIDSGVRPQPRLPNLTGGGDYIDPAADGLTDCDGHGTVVAGLIGAAPGPDGFAGVAPEAALVSIRQTSRQWSPKTPAGGDPQEVKTSGDVDSLARAIRHAADIPGVRVINISVTNCIPTYKTVDQNALGAALHYAAVDKDIVVVAAAGNAGEESCTSNPLATAAQPPSDPRNWAAANVISTPSFWQPYVLSVGSLTPEAQPSGFTMAGPWVGIAAPGEAIVSLGNAPNSGLINGQPSAKEPLVPIGGTSFASAYTSGVVALVRSKFPDLTAHQVINRLVSTAHNPARSPSNLVGAGVIDPVAALTWDIPAGPQQSDAPVIRVTPPAPVVPKDPLPPLVAFGIGCAAVAAATITITIIWGRRDRRD